MGFVLHATPFTVATLALAGLSCVVLPALLCPVVCCPCSLPSLAALSVCAKTCPLLSPVPAAAARACNTYVHVRWCPIRTNAYTRNTMVCTLHECTQAGVIWRWNTGPTDQDFSRSASPWSESGSEDAPSEPSANIPALAQVLAF
jgi:hypothetical protein